MIDNESVKFQQNDDNKSDVNRRAVLVVPCCEPGRGGGHLTRSIALVCGLQALGRESKLYIPATANDNATTSNFFNAAGFDKNWIITPSGEGTPSQEGADTGLQNISWECIVLDRFQTPHEELSRWMRLAPVIGIDEGGSNRNRFDFLIDILPNCEQIRPNIIDTSLLPLPKKPQRKSATPSVPFKILISFGREDAAGLGPATAQALETKNINGIEITLLHSGLIYSPSTPHRPLSLLKQTCLSCNSDCHLGSQRTNPSQKTQLDAVLSPVVPNLSEHLNEYDLVITHFGLTAFEALYAGVSVLLISPGAYHEKLARAAGFRSLGTGKDKAKKLPDLLFKHGKINKEFFDKLQSCCSALTVKYNIDNEPRQSLAELINSYTPNVSRNCPVCGKVLYIPAIARFPDRSYYRCNNCGVIGMNRLNPPPIEYGKDYFFDLYKKQYGKTYIEDFSNLVVMGKRRIAVIKSMLSSNKISSTDDNKLPGLLDIGCAYGPFLVAAKEEGFSPFGIDPAEDAINYVTQTFGIPAAQGYFPIPHYSFFITHSSFPVITLWYVIEHFRDCVPVLAEIRKLLKPGGVFAFATPSFSGISGRSSLRRFLDHSPADHWTIWSPAMCKKALAIAGFKVKKTINSGHHPERFPLLGKFTQSKKGPLYRMLWAISIIFTLGDTFEVYAEAK
jgi:2-polyprenyl-3-methyl-5-hydroxy-6-metoxy-1,4-benzoquinol methylase/spore coat polysaccharide biosynthesis predicted glycosyltransferase SpsG/predicted RNA-binding Zn-ribbon protein involved in translation (DUF1610 family)